MEIRLSNLEMYGPVRTYHSMHMHGYEFFLMAHGFATYEKGRIIGDNKNISCRNQTGCPIVDFNENVLKQKSRERSSFIAKNSILVPPQGYAIVRFRYSSVVITFKNCLQSVKSGNLADSLPPRVAFVRRHERIY